MKTVKVAILCLACMALVYLACSGSAVDIVPAAPDLIAEEAVVYCDTLPEVHAPVQSLTTGFWSYDPPAYKPVGVMIENTVYARPQWGLQTADVVYEANAEGAVTRFLAIFNDNIPSYVGPVRSARVYFIRMQQQWDCYYIHCGGATGRSDLINAYSPNLVHLANRRYDARVTTANRWFARREYDANMLTTPVKPHNVVVNPLAVYNKVSAECDRNVPLKFGLNSDYSAIGKAISRIQVRLKGVNVVWTYDSTTNKLLRSHGSLSSSTPHISAETKKQIEKQNLIIQYCDYSLHSDYSHRIIALNGSGKAEFVINGMFISGSWSRQSDETDTVYLDSDGNEILLVPGQTWIEIVPTGYDSIPVYVD